MKGFEQYKPSPKKSLPNFHQLKHIALKKWPSISPKTTNPTNRGFPSHHCSHLRCWCGVQWSKEGGIPFATLPFDRTGSGGGMGFPKSTKMQNTNILGNPTGVFLNTKSGSSNNFFRLWFFGTFLDIFFFALKSLRAWEPGKISPLFSRKKWQMRCIWNLVSNWSIFSGSWWIKKCLKPPIAWSVDSPRFE